MRYKILLNGFLTAFICICFVAAIFTGCRRKVVSQVFTYEENESGKIVITGLTDKGKEDSVITVPSSIKDKEVVSIGPEAFRGSANLNKVVISEGIERISENAFLNCNALSEIEFPTTIRYIGTNAFTKTSWLNAKLTQNKELIICNILCAVSEIKGEYSVPEGVEIISSGVFYNNADVTKVYLPESLKIIEDYAFSGCIGIKEIVLPKGLKAIGCGTFANSGIDELVIPSGVEEILSEAFLGIKHISYSGSASGALWGAESIN